ncbi:MAG: SDR family oxidoreductase [Cyclobacteriaceae bacterium]|nr:SDR family oxidoreductase [Cyclobacteriaceae bacterium]
MNLNLSGKTALVCGSTQGIGKAIAMELASMGANIVLMARNEGKLQQVTAELPNNNQKHTHLAADFSDPSQVKEVIDAFMEHHTIDILINNTGGPAGGQAIDANIDEFRQAFNAHLINNQILAQAVVPSMKKAKFGRIVNVISTSVKMPLKGLGVSNTIRGAVASWAKTLATELGEFGVTVNNVLPGATMTVRLAAIIENKAKKINITEQEVQNAMINEIPAKRFAEAEEVANAAAFLCSPAASYINGVNIPVDGGRTGCL